MLTTKQILEKYIKFFEERDHKKIPNVSLVPENDPTLLFVNSGMFPLVPYLSGQAHPMGKRLVNIQRALRLKDLEEIGDATHTLVFHMIGNWSLGDYFKKEQLPWIYEFLFTVLELDPKKTFATVFEGDENAPHDEESIKILKEVFAKYGIEAKENERIFADDSNWWQRGDTVGELGGPDSEIFYYIGEGEVGNKNPITHEKEFLEIGNSVFMQYIKTETGWKELPQKNVDFGGGLERITRVVQGKKDIFETDSFWPIIEKAQELSGKNYYENEQITRSMRILADHMRASTLLAMDGVLPSNKDQGYILRRLLRRMIRAGRNLGVETGLCSGLVPAVINTISWLYPELVNKQAEIEKLFVDEEEKFSSTLRDGRKEVARLMNKISEMVSRGDVDAIAQTAFNLYQSLGYPQEIFLDDLRDANLKIDEKEFDKFFKERFDKHMEQSHTASEGKFKGGLADHSEEVIKYHTAAHLLQAALKNVLGEHVGQAGSNLTGERLRYDFTHPQKLTEEEIKKTEDFINDIVDKKVPVVCVTMPKEEAIKAGAGYMKWETYPDNVKVYYVGDNLEAVVSKEICGGPHVSNTSELGHIKIYKQENIGKGKVRVYGKFL